MVTFGIVPGLPCLGGPLNGLRLELDCPQSGTLNFTLNGQTGRYKHDIEVPGYPNVKFECLRWEQSNVKQGL